MFQFRSVLLPAALLAAIAVPAVGGAQTQSNQPAQGQMQQGHWRGHRGGSMRFLKDLNLTPQQQAQITQIRQQYRQAHPRGSVRDPQAMKAMRDKIMAVLTPAQQAQLKADMQKRRAEFGRRGGDRFPQPSPSPAV